MATQQPDPEFETLLDFLKRTRGFDFGGYKRPSLMRLVQKRMGMVKVATFADYVDYIEVHPDEFTPLFNTLLINVTGFFRDGPVWEALAKEIVPKMVTPGDGRPLRIWSAGCATGEEAYTLAMVLAEHLGEDGFKKQVKIFATDVDEDALSEARLAIYPTKSLEALDPALREKYFEPVRNGHQFRTDLRRGVIFGRNDLLHDAPISHVDLIACRNTLMYFTAEAQQRILGRLHFALAENAYLVLGKAELMVSRSQLFRPAELRYRIFQKVSAAQRRERNHLAVPAIGGHENGNGNGNGNGDGQGTLDITLRDAAFERAPMAQLVIDPAGTLVMVNQRACDALGVSMRDVGLPFAELPVSYRPVDLRSHLGEAFDEKRPVHIGNVEHTVRGGKVVFYDVQIMPMFDPHGSVLGATITFSDVTRPQRLQTELVRAHQELETAYEELQSSNEELQSTNEELETTNEELQSTNEELETINEELQSTNEELQTVNDELGQRSEDVDRTNSFLESILGSLKYAVIVVNTKLDVIMWNEVSEGLWGLRQDEVRGDSFLGLDIGLPVEKLRPMLKGLLAGEEKHPEVTLPALNRRGKSIRCRVRGSPLHGLGGAIAGAILTIEELDD